MEKNYQTESFGGHGEKSLLSVSWNGLKVEESAKVLQLGPIHSASVQMSGNFGEGGLIVLLGSNDGINFMPLEDSNSNLIKKSSHSIENLGQFVRYIKPLVLGGDANTELDCHILLDRRL
jgi:hypothetical protein